MCVQVPRIVTNPSNAVVFASKSPYALVRKSKRHLMLDSCLKFELRRSTASCLGATSWLEKHRASPLGMFRSFVVIVNDRRTKDMLENF